MPIIKLPLIIQKAALLLTKDLRYYYINRLCYCFNNFTMAFCAPCVMTAVYQPDRQ